VGSRDAASPLRPAVLLCLANGSFGATRCLTSSSNDSTLAASVALPPKHVLAHAPFSTPKPSDAGSLTGSPRVPPRRSPTMVHAV
jgi:hypothetical protein